MAVDEFISKVKNRTAVIGIIGLGYVGLPLSIIFSQKGFKTIGFDTDAEKCEKLAKGESYIKHIPADTIKGLSSFEAVNDFSRISEADAVLICVPTPLTSNREPDMRYILSTIDTIAGYLRKGQLICLESTTYPGTTEELVAERLEEISGLEPGRDFWVAYSPEREDPNNREYTTSTIPKVIGGYTSDCLKVAETLYAEIVENTVPVSSTRTAEATKLLENIFRAVNIALVNELKMIFDKMGIDIWEVINAAKTKPFGFMPFYPGPGLGGHCIPIDPFYLAWKAREYGISTRFIELAGEINRSMPEYVFSKTVEGLNRNERPLKGSSLLIVGMAYKPDVDDTRESPALKMMHLFEKNGAHVDFHDAYIPLLPETRDYGEFAGRRSVDLQKAGEYDCVVIITGHSGIDYAQLVKTAKLVIDTRNVCPAGENVVRA